MRNTYYTRIQSWTDKNPEKIALMNLNGESADYSDLVSVYKTCAEFLNQLPIESYERITILTENELHNGMLIMPVIENATLVPLDLNMNEERFLYFYTLIGVDYIITDDLECAGCRAAERMGLGIIWFGIKKSDNRMICEFKIKKTKTDRLAKRKFNDREIVIVSTTSGTTSTPKIVPMSYSQHLYAVYAKTEHFEFVDKEIVMLVTRLTRSNTIDSMLMTLYTGGTAVLAGGGNYNAYSRFLAEYSITILMAVPAVLESYAKYLNSNDIRPSNDSLRFIRSSGAPLSHSLKMNLEKTFNTRVIQTYGMTETKTIASTYKSEKGYKAGSAGVPFSLEVKIDDGEILVRGKQIFNGYENSEIDKNIYFTDGWFHTGDMGYIDEDGYIFITGRIKEMINRGGEKISPYEVENALMKHPDIRDAAVFPYPNLYDSEDAGAVIVMHPDKKMNLTGLRKYLNGLVSPYKMPTILYIADEIPKSANDKVQRKMLFVQLKGLFPGQGKNENITERVRLTKTEKKLRKIWIKILRNNHIDTNISFIELGGDSLNGAVVLSEIENQFGIRIPVNILFEGGTIKNISKFVDSEKAKGNEFLYLVPIKSPGSKKPLICVHSGIGDAATYRHIGKHMEGDRPIYALRFEMEKTKWPQPLTFDYLSRKYVDEIKKMDPDGPYYICGNCWGGVLAFRIASMLKEDGCEVGMLAMFDSASKGIDKHEKEISNLLLKRFYSKFVESIDQLKGRPLKEKMRLIIKKIGNIVNLIRITQNKKLYRYGQKKNNIFLMNVTGKIGALGYSYQKYKPEFYDGKLYYFKATKGRSKKSRSQDYWSDLVKDFNLIEMNCHHNDMVVGKNSKIITDKLSKIMEAADV